MPNITRKEMKRGKNDVIQDRQFERQSAQLKKKIQVHENYGIQSKNRKNSKNKENKNGERKKNICFKIDN